MQQRLCDVFGLEVLKTAEDDASYGAALIGGVGIGVYASEKDAIDKCVKVVSSDKPDVRNHDQYQKLFEIYKKAQSNLVEINHELHKFSEAQN